MMENSYIHTTFDKLTLKKIIASNNKILKVHINGLDVYLKVFLKKSNQNLVVFSNGAVDLNKKKPPVFQRSSWVSQFNANCIFIDDATIHSTSMAVGWGVGRKNRHFLKDYSLIIKKIVSLLQLTDDKTIYFGSSAGGFMSIMLAAFHQGSIAVANNPQTWVRLQSQGSRAKRLYNNIFPNMTEEDILNEFKNRLSVIQSMKENKYIPRIIYLLNRYSEADVIYQFEPFKNFIDKNTIDQQKRIEFIEYHSDKGHSGVYDKEKTIKLINSCFDNKQITITKEIVESKKQDLSLSIYEKNNELIKMETSKDELYIPVGYLYKGNYAELSFTFKYEKGNMAFELLSQYYSKKAIGYLNYEIYRNDEPILKEDMSVWKQTNSVGIFNLNRDDKIKIRVLVNRNCNNKSWMNASRLKILKFMQVKDTRNISKNITCSSPYSVFSVKNTK